MNIEKSLVFYLYLTSSEVSSLNEYIEDVATDFPACLEEKNKLSLKYLNQLKDLMQNCLLDGEEPLCFKTIREKLFLSIKDALNG